MKVLSKHLALLLFIPLLFSCSSSDDEIHKLEFSVEGPIMTGNVDYEFNIDSGNGGYVATVSQTDGDDDAIVTIDGNKVTVNILAKDSKHAEITITDKKNQTASLSIASAHKSLQKIPDYGIYLDEGQTSTMNEIEFGAGGPYTIEKVRGKASTAIVENGKIKITSHELGDTYYKVKDRRGTVTSLITKTVLVEEMTKTSNSLDITAINNLSVSIKLTWGEEWEIVTSTSNIIESISVGRPINAEPGSESDYDFILISTVDKGSGTDSATLKDKDGNMATVKITIK